MFSVANLEGSTSELHSVGRARHVRSAHVLLRISVRSIVLVGRSSGHKLDKMYRALMCVCAHMLDERSETNQALISWKI